MVVQSYAEMVMARTGIIEGEVGVIEEASIGAALICDVEIDSGLGAQSIYSTKPTFIDGSTAMTAGVLCTTNFFAGDKLTFRVIQIGSDPTFGKGLRFMLKCRV